MRNKRALYGFNLLRRQLWEQIEQEFSCANEWIEGDSEIERLFHAALVFGIIYSESEFTKVITEHSGADLQPILESEAKTSLIVQSQVQIGDWRVDFLIRAWTPGRVWKRGAGYEQGSPRWRHLIVECDGHEFHERTKEQAARDRSRDREANLHGYDLFRFTGSELWRDPMGCAEQVYEWAVRGF